MRVDRLYIGLMSGTSLDGIDAVLADFGAAEPLLASHHAGFDAVLREALWSLMRCGADEIDRAATAANRLANAYADAIAGLLESARVERRAVAAIGCHGQTIRHRPERGYSVQLVNGALLAELTGLNVVCDFRSRDIAAGGQGAPLVPAFHAAAFRDATQNRAVVNLGGIANVTVLPAHGPVRGFDCGPGNALLDEWSLARRSVPFDANGAWAAAGKCLPELLDALLRHPFLAQPPPKSTGRETFNLEWARQHLRTQYADQDVQATFAELTARCIADAIGRWVGRIDAAYLCGGGARNTDLSNRIRDRLGGTPVVTTDALGVAPEHVEALAFAWLARERMERRPVDLTATTGAAAPRILGSVYPA